MNCAVLSMPMDSIFFSKTWVKLAKANKDWQQQ
jgi:hypothetical protein